MSDYDIYTQLVALAGRFPTEDGIEFDEYLWSNLYEYGTGDVPEPAQIAEITKLAASSPEGYASTNVAFIGRLVDDRWVTCVAWSDTSGFDCRGAADWRINDTLAMAIAFGLDTEGRAWLGLDELKPGGAA